MDRFRAVAGACMPASPEPGRAHRSRACNGPVPRLRAHRPGTGPGAFPGPRANPSKLRRVAARGSKVLGTYPDE